MTTTPARYHGMPPHPARALRYQLLRRELGGLPLPPRRAPVAVRLRATHDQLPTHFYHYLQRVRAAIAHAVPLTPYPHPLRYTSPRVTRGWSYEPAHATPLRLPSYPGAPHP